MKQAARVPFLCCGCTESHSKWAAALQRMPLLSGVTMQKKRAQKSKSKPILSIPLKKRASSSFTFADRPPPPIRPPPERHVWQAADLGSRHSMAGASFTHTLLYSVVLSGAEFHLLNKSTVGAWNFCLFFNLT